MQLAQRGADPLHAGGGNQQVDRQKAEHPLDHQHQQRDRPTGQHDRPQGQHRCAVKKQVGDAHQHQQRHDSPTLPQRFNNR